MVNRTKVAMNLCDMNFLQTLVDYNIYFQKIITDCRLLGIRHPGSLKCLNLIGCMCYNNITGSHKIYSRVHDLPIFFTILLQILKWINPNMPKVKWRYLLQKHLQNCNLCTYSVTKWQIHSLTITNNIVTVLFAYLCTTDWIHFQLASLQCFVQKPYYNFLQFHKIALHTCKLLLHISCPKALNQFYGFLSIINTIKAAIVGFKWQLQQWVFVTYCEPVLTEWLWPHTTQTVLKHTLITHFHSISSRHRQNKLTQSNGSMQHCECVALCKNTSLQKGWFCARSLASCIPRSSKDRSSWI